MDPEEFAGFQGACSEAVQVLAVRIRTDGSGPRPFRAGRMPVLGGTFFEIDDRSGHISGSGLEPRLATYGGRETLVPLTSVVPRGDASNEQLARDIFGLERPVSARGPLPAGLRSSPRRPAVGSSGPSAMKAADRSPADRAGDGSGRPGPAAAGIRPRANPAASSDHSPAS